MSVQLNRIEREFIFRALHEERTPVQLRRGREKLSCRVAEFDRERLVLDDISGSSPDGSPLQEGEEVHLFFNVRDNMMTCTATIRQIEDGGIVLSSPHSLYRDLGRTYERIPAPDDLTVSFAFKGSIVELDFPRSSAYESLEDVKISSSFDASKLSELMVSFREKASEFATETRIIMFRGREPEGFEENAICRSGACLYIPSVREGFCREPRIREAPIVSEENLLRFLEESGKTRQEAEELLKGLLEKKRRQENLAELYCPIRYLSYVIGYIYATSGPQRTGVLTPQNVEFVYNFSRILAFSLKVNGYFQGTSRLSYERTRLIDISGSGLLFCHDRQQISSELGVASVIDLTLRLGDRTIETKGRIARYYRDDTYMYYGVQFLGMSPQDFSLLHARLYGENEQDNAERRPKT